MASTYPGAIDSTADSGSLDLPDDDSLVEDLPSIMKYGTHSAVVAVESTLGTNPQGTEADVDARIGAVEGTANAAAPVSALYLAQVDVYYRAQIAAVAGEPAGILTEPGQVDLHGLGAYQGRTMYVVFDVDINDLFRMKLVDMDGFTVAIDTGTGIPGGDWPFVNATPESSTREFVHITTQGQLTTGRYVACLTVNDGITQLTGQLLGNSEATAALTPGDGLATDPVFHMSSSHGYMSLRGTIYTAGHTTEQHDQLMTLMKAWADARDSAVHRVGAAYGATAPANPPTPDLWIDTGGTAPVLKVWDGTAWQTVGA